MMRFHVHVNVRDLDASIRFYSNLFAAAPTVVKRDYAKWMIDDPRLNFAISTRDRAVGIDHVGIEAGDGAELEELSRRLAAANAVALVETGTTCCYARSDKTWAEDPQGLRWETFHTFDAATTYYAPEAGSACCAPAEPAAACCGAGAVDASSRCGA